MQNFPIFFLDNAKEMCEFTYAGVVESDYPGYLARHKKTARILDEMEKIVEGSVLTTTYWGLLPFGIGDGKIVKYRLDPQTAPENVPDDAPGYLATDLAQRLSRPGPEYRFDFMVQPRTNPDTMPLDEATVQWPEHESPFVKIATLVIPHQDVSARGQAEYGQSLAFNIFRVPPEQAPVPESSIAAVRKVVYAASARTRHDANGQPLEDMPEPRPFKSPPARDDCVVKAVVYPPIGIARVGNSDAKGDEGYFIGPEVPDPPPLPAGSYRDHEGKLKRQAARFRVYGANARGEIVRELTCDPHAEITWTVELANTKAAWYGFQLALDIPEAASAPPTTLRNATVADRTKLAIVPGPRSVGGRGAKAKAFDTGEFMGKRVYLGEIWTDEDGRLLVLGGKGQSASSDGSRAITFANNEGWYDDVSDGPVRIDVTLDGTPLDTVPAWIVVAPPNYAPQRKSVRTMWDLMRDVAIKDGTLAAPTRPSFTADILPIFERLNGLQWVNAGFAAGFGWNGSFDLSTAQRVQQLADASPATREIRKMVANEFRRFNVDSWSPKPWPWLYGDAMNIPTPPTPRAHAALTDTQLAMLDQWAAGDFDADYDPSTEPKGELPRYDVAQQGDVLTKAALEFCLADAFHPGCEMTWPVRTATMYMAPFRFAHAKKNWIAPNLGGTLTSDDLKGSNGPLGGQQAGGITRWMAVPWQTDTASCRSGYDTSYDPYVPAFWPAHVPNEVLTRENYEIVMNVALPISERRKAFANRAAWVDPLGTTSYTNEINNMIAHFDHLGVVETRDGPVDRAFPPMEVEDQHKTIDDVPLTGDEHQKDRIAENPRLARRALRQNARPGAPGTSHPADISGIEKFRRFPAGLPVYRE
jgi:hypothetical protein